MHINMRFNRAEILWLKTESTTGSGTPDVVIFASAYHECMRGYLRKNEHVHRQVAKPVTSFRENNF